MQDSALLGRAHRFLRTVEDGVATRRIDGPLGTTLANDDYPVAHSMNFVRIEAGADVPAADAVEAAIVEAMDAIGRSHLQAVIPDARLGARLAQELRPRGWQAFELTVMAWRRPPERDPQVAAAVVPFDVVRPTILSAWLRGPRTEDPDIARQLTDRRHAIARAVNIRHVVAPAPPQRIGATADLYSDGTTAQIESVYTLEEFRNRGLATAAVLHAARLAEAERHALIFLVADAHDWPMRLYQRLGFDEIGRYWELAKDR